MVRPGRLAYFAPATSLGEEIFLPGDEFLNGLRGSASDVLDRGSHAVISVLPVEPGDSEQMLVDKSFRGFPAVKPNVPCEKLICRVSVSHPESLHISAF